MSKLTGRFGETAAAEYLRTQGYEIVGMNYQTRLGEIDIIARNRKYLCFVEVKLRKNADFGTAAEFVTKNKQRKLILCARSYLQSKPDHRQPRFDVVEVYAPNGVNGELTINHIEDAFQLN